MADNIIESSFSYLGGKFRWVQFEMQPGTTRKELENSETWDMVAAKLMTGDELRVIATDYSKLARGIVVFSDQRTATVKILHWHSLEGASAAKEPELRNCEVRHRPNGWSVVRKTTGKVIKSGIATKSAAWAAAEDYEKAMKR